MNKPTMQHYLSKGYLRGFTPTGDKKGRLRVIDLLERKCFTTSPKDVAKIRDYYAFEDGDGELNYVIEKGLLEKVDGRAAGALARIDERKAIPTGEDWEVLASFIALLKVRVPKFRQTLHEMEEHFSDMIQARLGDSPEPELSDQEKANKKADLLKHMLEMGSVLYDRIRLMTPHLLIAKGKGRFITGDAPIFLFDTNDERRLSGLRGVGFNTPEVEATIPLSRNCCLALRWGGRSTVMEIEDEDVAYLNHYRALATRQYLFASQGDVPVMADGEIIWGEDSILNAYADMKAVQPAVKIEGGGVPRRPLTRVKR